MIPTVRCLSDPFKNARLYYVLEPLLRKEIKFEGPKKKKLNEILKVTKEWAQKEAITRALYIYQAYHKHLVENLQQLKGKQIIFLPGNSMDITLERQEIAPRQVYSDAFSDRFRLTDDLIKIVIELNKSEGWNCFDDFHFIAVNHLIMPFHVTRDFRIRHSLEEAVRETDHDMEREKKNARWGAVEKSLAWDFRQENSRFGEYLYSAERAKDIYGKKIARLAEKFRKGIEIEKTDKETLIRLFGDEEAVRKTTQKDINREIQDHCYFNSFLLAHAYQRVVEELGIKNPVIYARKSNFSSSIIGKLRFLGTEPDKWGKKGIMKNSDLSRLGESDPSALDFLKQRLYVFFEEKVEYRESEPEHLDIPEIPEISSDVEIRTKPQPCIFCDRIKCRYTERCRYEKDAEEKGKKFEKKIKKCTYDFSQNRFTRDDVREMAEALQLDENPDELYEQLLFKPVKVKYYDPEKRTFVIREANEFDLLVEDAVNEGYTFADIMLDGAILNSKFDEDIHLLRHRKYLSTSWVKFSQGMKIKPLKVDAKKEIANFQVRGSEFASRCHIGRLIAKMDKQKFNIGYENYYAVVGTARHKLANERPWLDYLGKRDLHVAEYCEQVVAGDFLGGVSKGHGDGFFEMAGNGKKYMLVLDYKRARKGAYEKPAYLLQLLQYGKSIQQMLGREYDGMVLCLVKRFFHGEYGGENWPEYSLFFVPKRGEDEIALTEITYDEQKGRFRKNQRISGMDKIIENSVCIQKRLLDEPKFFWRYITLAADCKMCCNKDTVPQFRECFNREICEILREKVRNRESIRKYFLEGVEL